MTKVIGPSASRGKLSAAKIALLEKRLRGEFDASIATARITARPAGPAPLSFAQLRLWFLDQLEPGSPAYNIPAGFWLKGPLDVVALQRSLNEILQRHEVLRARFPADGGKPIQIIEPEQCLRLAAEPIRDFGVSARQAVAQTLAREEAIRPFNLAKGPLIRVRLFQLSEPQTQNAAGFDYLMVVTLHHIAADAWSIDILIRELAALYPAFVAGQLSPLNELPIHYPDYAHWQRTAFEEGSFGTQLAYWRERLAGHDKILNLPSDHLRPVVSSHKGEVFSWRLSCSVTHKLDELSEHEGVTLFMLLLAAFNILLFRYTGQNDLCIGTPVANRNRIETEGLVGFLTNTLVLRTDVSGNPTFVEVLRRVREVVLGALAHQDLPFERLVEEFRPQRDLVSSPLIQVMFVLQNAPLQVIELGDLVVTPLALETATAKFDLTLSLTRDREGLRASIEYAAALFNLATIERMARHYGVLLSGIATSPRALLSELPFLGASEQAEIVQEWSGAGKVVDKARPRSCLGELFAAQAARNPDAVAVICEAERLTYGALNARANRLAHHLLGLGVGAETVVGLCVERSLDMVIGILGILKAGGAYLPLDPSYPKDRLAYLVTDAGIPVLLTQEKLLGCLPETLAKTICLDGDAWQWARSSDVDPPTLCGPANLAYVIYTSGSTGQPKGVMVSHGNVTDLFSATEAAFGFGPEDVWTLFHSYAFDFSVWEIWGALLYGGRLVVVPYWVSRAPEAFYELLARTEVTVLNQTPSAFRQLLQTEAFAEDRERLVLRLVIFGGEALDPRSLRPWFDRHGETSPLLVNMYGITETTVHVTMCNQGAAQLAGKGSIIGRPIDGVRTYVLDAVLQPVPVGVEGELYIGGFGLARAYLGRPDLTAERFVPDPFGGAGGRLYRTGDLARWQPDGNLEYAGRLDHQVKIRGHRIELGEIETALCAHPAVNEAVVVVLDDASGGEMLVAYVVSEAEPDVLRTALQERLPDYSIPVAFVRLGALPLTQNGKIDRKALPPPGVDAHTRRQYIAPRNLAEMTLCQIWAETLGLDRVGIEDNFFALGGHSLSAVTLIARLRHAGLQTDVRALFSNPTPAALAGAIGTCSGVAVPPNLIPPGCDAIRSEMLPLVNLNQADIDQIVGEVPGGAPNVQDIYPLAPLQEGILFHNLMAAKGDPYLMPVLLAFDGRERLDGFLGAIQSVIARHDILRTAVAWEGLPEAVQVVWCQAPLHVEDVRLDPAEGDIDAQLRARFDPRQFRIDLRKAPLLRGFVARDASGDRWLLLLLAHHLVLDHTTLEILVEEAQTYLQGRGGTLPAPLPFRNFVAQARLGVSRADHEAFFKAMLGDVSEPTAPFGLLDVQGDGSKILESRLDLDPVLAQQVRKRARFLGVSAASLFHTAFAHVLARVSGHPDVVFGTVLFGRMQGGENLDRALGIFINTLPVRIRVGAASVTEGVRRAHELLGELLRHEHASLALAQRCSAVAAPAPLFSALLNYRHSTGRERSSGEVPPDWEGVETLYVEERTNYPLTLSVDDFGEGFQLTVQIQAPIAPPRICSYMRVALEQLVDTLEKAPDTAERDIDILGDAERRQLLVDWNTTATHYPKDCLLHEMFEAQAARAPDAIAVVCGEEALTYAELNSRGNQLAHYLCGLGVGAEAIVGLCVERSLDMIIGILGILKAGGAYLPLDPSYPGDRLAYMIEDVGPVLVLTQERLRERLPAAVKTFFLDEEWEMPAGAIVNIPAVAVTAQNLAYVIYTSGSTGRPKGVGVSHRNAGRLFAATEAEYSFSATDVWALFHSFAFDFSVWEIFGALLYGGRLVIVPYWISRSPEAFHDFLTTHAVTVLNQTPSSFYPLDAEDAVRGTDKSLSLRLVIFGGEALEPKRLAGWFGRHGDDCPEFVNMYGITETTVHVTLQRLKRGDAVGTSKVGRPLADLQAFILDAGGDLAPIEVAGELYIGGAGLARGYLGRPDLTAERFVPNPFGGAGERLYRTGDLACYGPDGTIEYLGRIDQQVKIRGFRIELGEIEARLVEHPAVGAAVVMARKSEAFSQLIAYVVCVPDMQTGLETLRDWLRERLPDYMVPTVFVRLDTLPLTPNGKIDRKTLPATDNGIIPQASYTAPRTAIEETLARIWKEVLGVEKVGVTDNFFALGGDSILSIQVVGRARRHGLMITPRQLFEHQTLAALAVAAETDIAAAQAVSAEQGAVSGDVPLMPIQRWFFDLPLPNPHHWNQSILLEARSILDPDLLEQAVVRLVAHHDALRMRFAKTDSTVQAETAAGWRQRNLAADSCMGLFVRVDLSGIPSASQKEALGDATTALQRSLHLETGPLIRAGWFNLGESQLLLLAAHHLVVDGVSWRILLEDLQSVYRQLSAGAGGGITVCLSKTTSFKQWSERLWSYSKSPSESEGLREEEAYWSDPRRLDVLPLPVDDAGGSNEAVLTESVARSLTEYETRALLQDVPAAYRTQINDILLTALVQALSRWSGHSAFLVDLEGHGREELFPEVDLSRTVGWFTTLFPVLLRSAVGNHAGDALKSIKEQQRTIPRKGIGYGLLRYGNEGSSIERHLKAQPAAQISFNYLGQFDQSLPEDALFAMAGAGVGLEHDEHGIRPHEWDFSCNVLKGCLQLSLSYSGARYRRMTAEWLMETYLQALRDLILHCLRPDSCGYTPSDFCLAQLSQPQLDQLFGGVRGIEDVYPLTPLQQGILFHVLYAPESGVYVEHLSCTLQGPLDTAAFTVAWQQVMAAHPVLRSSFRWENLDAPVQVVHAKPVLPIEEQDWRGVPTEEQPERWAAYLEADRQAGFDFAHAPLMRLALMRCAGDRWLFLWSHHHVLLDGWSLALVLKEVFGAYEAVCRGEPPRFLTSRPYRDYLAWLTHQDMAAAEAYWRQTLAGFRAATPLPFSSLAAGNAPVSCDRYAEISLTFGAEKTRVLEDFARRHHVTLNTLVQGAWAILLSRTSGERDVLFGVTVSGRPAELSGIESMVGLFINTLPLRVAVPPDAHVSSWLRSLFAQNLQLRQYEYTPLVDVQGWSEVPRGAPLFASLLVFENYPVNRSLSGRIGNVEIGDTSAQEQTNYPITVSVSPGMILKFDISYDCALFDVATVTSMLGHFSTLLKAIAASPDVPIGALPLLNDAESRQLLVEWNATAVDCPKDHLLHELFAAQAARNPDAVAVMCEAGQLTYGELNAKSNRLAHHLRNLGVVAETIVGLCVERSLDMVIGILGILKAGGAYLPLDPAYPRKRLAYLLADAGSEVLLTQENLLGGLPAIPVRTVRLDRDAPQWVLAPDVDPPQQSRPANLAYVIYTSGSTGLPKGVMVTHESLNNLVHAQTRTFDLNQRDRVLQFSSISFDQAAEEMFPTWLSGATLVLPPRGDREFLLDFVEFIVGTEITVAALTTAYWCQLTMELMDAKKPLPASLRLVFVGGEKVPAESLRCWRALASENITWINTYGPTEATITTTAFFLSAASADLRDVPIGRPLANTRVYVLDRNLEPVPVGIEGELYIAGFGVARGYLGCPDLTAERFVPDAFGGAGERLYRTGDLVRWSTDGNLHYAGRIDNQVKIRGHRIELGEIETALSAVASVRQAIVVALADPSGSRRLVAYVVGDVTAEILRAALRKNLPDYMIPASFVPLDVLPLTENGKVNRKALPPPEGEPDVRARYITPRTAIEEILAGIWADVLRRECVGIDESFFEIGGHSLSAIRTISRIRRDLNVEVSLRSLFEAPTVAKLACLISNSGSTDCSKSNPAAASLPLSAGPRGTPIPLSFAQQRLWFLDQLEPNSSFYNIPLAVRLTGRLDIAALRRALIAVGGRHEVLRTCFPLVDGKPVQSIQPDLEIGLPLIPLHHVPAEARAAELLRLILEEAHKPFDLAVGPLIRGCIFEPAPAEEGGANEYILVLSLHHSIADGWSMGILIEELAVLYKSFVCTEPSPLADLSLQYADYSLWQREYLTGQEFERQVTYWRARLSDAPAILRLPTDWPRPQIQSYSGASYSLFLPLNLSEKLGALARRNGATMFMVLLAALKLLLFRHSGQNDICVGTPVANRRRIELEGLIGCFVNTLVLRTDLSGDPCFTDLLTRVRTATLEAQDHQDLPFERLVMELDLARELGHNPLFQVAFSLDNTPDSRFEMSDLIIEAFDVETKTAMFDLSVDVVETADGLLVLFEYNTDLYLRTSIENFASHYETLLNAISARPDARLSNLEMLTGPERRWLFDVGHSPDISAVKEQAEMRSAEIVVTLIEDQAKRFPDRLAVVDGDCQLTYQEINLRANRLAHRLIGLGAGPETVIGILTKSSIELVVALLAVLKAGAAYVPLDPSYPHARLQAMLEASSPSILLLRGAAVTELTGLAQTSIVLDNKEDAYTIFFETNPAVQINRENLAYVLFTSGSTGRPKGVAVSHRSLVNRVKWGEAEFGLGPDDVIIQRASPSFDVSVGEIFGCLAAGACLVIAGAAAGDPKHLIELIVRHSATMIELPPSLLWLVLNEPRWRECRTLRVVSCGGEAMSESLREKFVASLDCRLYNTYGPAEATIDSSFWPCGALDDYRVSDAGVPIGRPIGGVSLHVLDQYLNLVPLGVAGELYIAGIGLARGYFRQPALTAEWFVPDPFATDGGRLYRTGDLVRRRSDGALEFLGRVDHQVKLRGFRIELEEIESRLEEVPGVAEAAVVLRTDSQGEQSLAAFVATQDDNITSSVLRRQIRARLPAFMVPSTWQLMVELPRGNNGKLQRDILSSLLPVHNYPAILDEDSTPATALEARLAFLFAEILSLPLVGRNDNFFELGGHSLLAVQLAQRARDAIQTEIPLVALFQYPTVAELAEWLQSQSEDFTSLFVTLREGAAERLPLYLFHTGAGHVRGYQPLLATLDRDNSIYGIQMRAMRDPSLEPQDFETVVEDYADELRAHHHGECFRLMGWSLGGLIALGVAARLEALGSNIDFLGLIDTTVPRKFGLHDWKGRLAEFLDNPQDHRTLANLPELEVAELQRFLTDIPDTRHAASAALWGRERGLWLNHIPMDILRLETSLWEHVALIEDTFSTPRLATGLHVWWAQGTLGEGNIPPVDWPAEVKSIAQVRIIEGDHKSIISSVDLHASVRDVLSGLDA